MKASEEEIGLNVRGLTPAPSPGERGGVPI